MTHFRKAVLAVFLFTAILAGGATDSRADDIAEAKQTVSTLVQDALSTFSNHSLSSEQRPAKLREFLIKYGDLDASAQDILGRYWAKATTEQQDQFRNLVIDYALGSWAKQLDDVPSAQTINFVGGESKDGRIILHSLSSQTGDGNPVDWIMLREANGRLAVIDVAVEGVSICQTMKSDFTAIIRANGGSFDALLDALRKKISSYKTAS